MCCPAGALGFLAPDHKEQGRKEDLDGVAAYISGELRDEAVIAVSDVWGWNTGTAPRDRTGSPTPAAPA
ncbi:hypothetical protein DIPPA_10863 [Diplonema papillatum]|nr:hypothetical protein DIPPA_10863 [Diplonema papillatum]